MILGGIITKMIAGRVGGRGRGRKILMSFVVNSVIDMFVIGSRIYKWVVRNFTTKNRNITTKKYRMKTEILEIYIQSVLPMKIEIAEKIASKFDRFELSKN